MQGDSREKRSRTRATIELAAAVEVAAAALVAIKVAMARAVVATEMVQKGA